MTPPPSYSPSPRITTTTRRDPVKDIIIAQAAARQQLHELALPFSGASILHTTASSAPYTDDPNTPTTTLNIALPTAHRPHTPALLSSFQVSRPSSPTHHDPPPRGLGLILTCRNDADPNPVPDSAAFPASLLEEVPRGKRSRPTPSQLVALRRLHTLTDSPTIEERIQLGNEIGMELGKVTNWFRNLRQTARKKEKRARELGGEADVDEVPPRPTAAQANRHPHTPSSSSKRRHDEAHPVRKRPKLEAYPAPSSSAGMLSPILFSPSSMASPSSRRARSSFGSDYDHPQGHRGEDLVHHDLLTPPYRRHAAYDDHDRHSILSETDSSASTTHEAVTPPPHPQPALPPLAPPMEVDSAVDAPVHVTPTLGHAAVVTAQTPPLEGGKRLDDPSVDDALLLLAFRDGR